MYTSGESAPWKGRQDMRSHFVVALLIMLMFAFAGPAALPASEGPDSLWAKAISLYEANDNWVPGSVYMRMQEVDKHGEPKEDKLQEVWTRVYPGEDGEVEAELVKALDNGEDITEEEKEKREEEERERDSDDGDGDDRVTMEGYIPFDPEHQCGMSIVVTGDVEVVEGKRCVVFDFEDERKGDDEDDDDDMVVMGKVWLDAESGAPLKLEYTTDPLPKRVKKMKTTVMYEFTAPDAWQAASMSVQATGGFLFIKKHFHMHMDFSDHWRMPEEGGDVGDEGTGMAGDREAVPAEEQVR